MKTELANYLNAETEKLKAQQRCQHTGGRIRVQNRKWLCSQCGKTLKIK